MHIIIFYFHIETFDRYLKLSNKHVYIVPLLGYLLHDVECRHTFFFYDRHYFRISKQVNLLNLKTTCVARAWLLVSQKNPIKR
jgi:hypothetical protein